MYVWRACMLEGNKRDDIFMIRIIVYIRYISFTATAGPSNAPKNRNVRKAQPKRLINVSKSLLFVLIKLFQRLIFLFD